MQHAGRKGWWLALLPVILLVTLYLTCPWWLPSVVGWLLPKGYTLQKFSLSQPSFTGWHIKAFEITAPNLRFSVTDAYFSWQAQPNFIIKQASIFLYPTETAQAASDSKTRFMWPRTLPSWLGGKIEQLQITTYVGQLTGKFDLHRNGADLSGCWQMIRAHQCGTLHLAVNANRNLAQIEWLFSGLSKGQAKLWLGLRPYVQVNGELSTRFAKASVATELELTARLDQTLSHSDLNGHFTTQLANLRTPGGNLEHASVDGWFSAHGPDWRFVVHPKAPFRFKASSVGSVNAHIPALSLQGKKDSFAISTNAPWQIETKRGRAQIQWLNPITCESGFFCTLNAKVAAVGELVHLLPNQNASGQWHLQTEVVAKGSPSDAKVNILAPSLTLNAVSLGRELSIPALTVRAQDQQLTWPFNASEFKQPINFSAEGLLNAMRQSMQLKASGKVTLHQATVHGEMAMGSESLSWNLNTKFSDFQTHVKVEGEKLTIPRWWPTFVPDLHWDAGSFDIYWAADINPRDLPSTQDMQVWLQWLTNVSKAGNRLHISTLYGRYKKLGWQNVQAMVHLDAARQWNVTLTADNVQAAAGYALSNIQWQGSVSDRGLLNAGPLTATLFDGQLATDAFKADLFAPINLWRIQNRLTVQAMSIEALTKSLQLQGLSAIGKVNLTAPIRWENAKLSIENGEIVSQTPGIIRYQKGLAKTNIAFSALENFHYKTLNGKLSYAPDGRYQIKLRIVGTNPDMPDLGGVPIAFNPTIQGQLPPMFWAVFVTGDFEQNLLKKMKRQ